MVIIGITGQTGAGKTTALSALTPLGGYGIDCDALYHRLLATSPPLREDLESRFGNLGDHTIDRKKLGDIVFHDPVALADLNAITHRHIMAAVVGELAKARGEGRPAVAIDAIRLIESGLSALCHRVVAVTASEDTRVERIMVREGISRQYATARVAAQQSQDFYLQHADYVLDSDTTSFQELEGQASALFQTILSESKE